MDWKNLLGAAPALAKAIGGPAGIISSAALSALGSALGVDAHDPAALEARLASPLTPADELALKQADQKFALDVATIDLERLRTDAADRSNARAREAALKDWLPKVLAIFWTALLGLLLWVLFKYPIPAENRTAFDILLGVVAGAETQILNYYFGSSSGSADKSATISKALAEKA